MSQMKFLDEELKVAMDGVFDRYKIAPDDRDFVAQLVDEKIGAVVEKAADVISSERKKINNINVNVKDMAQKAYIKGLEQGAAATNGKVSPWLIAVYIAIGAAAVVGIAHVGNIIFGKRSQ